MRKILLLILCCHTALYVYSQTEFDQINIGWANDVIEMNFNDRELPDNYLICIANKYIMLIFECDDTYVHRYYETLYPVNKYEYYGEEIIVMDETSTRCKRRNKKRKESAYEELKRIFTDCNICNRPTTFISDSLLNAGLIPRYETANYFVLYQKGVKICEYNLPMYYMNDQDFDVAEYGITVLDSSSFDYLFYQKLYPFSVFKTVPVPSFSEAENILKRQK